MDSLGAFFVQKIFSYAISSLLVSKRCAASFECRSCVVAETLSFPDCRGWFRAVLYISVPHPSLPFHFCLGVFYPLSISVAKLRW